MFKTETHLHVSEVSPCSMVKAAEMIKLYHQAGYSTVFVTDHFKQGYCDSFGDIPWQDKITIFLSGYYKAKHAALKYGINVLLAAEFAFEDTPNHYLAYGITKEFLLQYPDVFKQGVAEFYKKAKQHGVFVVQAHPYRDEICFPTPEYADAIEAYNSNPRHIDYSEKSQKFAADNGLLATSGSDAHRLEDVGLGGVITETEIRTTEDYIELLKGGKVEFIRG